MKKNICILVLCYLSSIVMANDTIFLVSNDTISVDIRSVSKNEIIYRDESMPNGPDFILSTDDIEVIKFRNGQVKKFTHNTQNKEVSKEEIDYQPLKNENGTENMFSYLSSNNEVKISFDFSKKEIYIHSKDPMFINAQMSRNIVITSCNINGKSMKLIFDMNNRISGVAVTTGLMAFVDNIQFYRYFKKKMVKTFEIEVPYDTESKTYKMSLVY